MQQHLYSVLVCAVVIASACGSNEGGEATSDSASTGDASTTSLTEVVPTTGADEASTGETDASTGETDDSTGGIDLDQFYGCDEQAFSASPLAGPGFDGEGGGIQGPLADSYVLHTTQIYLRPEGAATFFDMTVAILDDAVANPGLIAFSVGTDDVCGVARTMGIWASEEAMYAFVTRKPHLDAMAVTTELTFTGRVTHWTATADEANAYTWDVARAKISDVEPSPIY